MQGQLIGISGVRALWSVSDVTIWRAIRDRGFPKPRYFGKRRFWVRGDVEMWLDASARSSSGAAPKVPVQTPEKKAL